MGMYDTFETDPALEAAGVWLDYGDFRVLLASAGQGNKSYVRYAEKKLKPVRRALESGALSNERSQSLMADIYAKTIILSWETSQGTGDEAKMVSGIEAKDGSLLPFNEANVEQALLSLPRLFMDLQEQAASLANFRKGELESEGKNS
tara:strand:+ start:12859 stop:13302 length:444 start_codon:yes stop_codon:yes gene_type:complete